MAAPASELPRVRVAALVRIDDHIVLVRHRYRDHVYHLLPGGGVSWGETLAEALVREVREETGLEVTIGRLLFVNDTIDPSGVRHVVNITFAATAVGGHITDRPLDPRVEAVDLMHPESLSTLDLRPPMAEQIRAASLGESDLPVYLGSLFSEPS